MIQAGDKKRMENMTDPKSPHQNLVGHYRRPGLGENLLAALEKAGKTVRSYEDTAAFDEFHMRGRAATRDLAHFAEIGGGMRVLDLGCGLGGPARLLSAGYGAHVTGIDLMEEFIEAAVMLTRMAGMARPPAFVRGDMLYLPFCGESFDAAWSQHTLMNIADKGVLFGEIHRVLVAGGLLAVYDVVAGSLPGRHYPVQWASNASMDHLPGESQMLQLLDSCGFEPVRLRDETAACLQWFESIRSKMKKRAAEDPPDAPSAPGLHLVIGPDTAEKAANTVRNLHEDRIRVIMGIWKKTGGAC